MSEVGDQETQDVMKEGDFAGEGNKPPFPYLKWSLLLLVIILMGLGAFILTQRVIVPKLTGLDRIGEKVRAIKENVDREKLEKDEKKKKLKKVPVISHAIEGVVANAAGSRGRRFVTFDIIVETKYQEAQQEMTAKEYQIRDALINYFGGRSVTELSTREFLYTAKDTIRGIINGLLENGEVDTVFFNKFLIQ